MTMKTTKQLTIFSIVLLFSLISSIVFPITVLADDTTPPPGETSEPATQPAESVITQEPVATQEPVTIEEPVATKAPTILPDFPITPTIEESSPVEATPTAPAATEAPATQGSATQEPAAPEEEPVDLTEIVSAAAENDLTLADADGEPLVLSTVETAETLATGDPYIIRSGVTHRFLADCTGQPINATNTCTQSSTPIQAAINFALAGETIVVEAGT